MGSDTQKYHYFVVHGIAKLSKFDENIYVYNEGLMYQSLMLKIDGIALTKSTIT
tara:strand:- start:67 stop:228 length:162 start_codon:yes stop_codon:yes gene_type:complete